MKYFQLLGIFLCILLSSCNDSGDKTTPSTPKIDIELPASGIIDLGKTGSSTIRFTSNSKWSIITNDTRNSSWLTVEPTSGGAGDYSLKLTAAANRYAKVRKSVVNIQAGEINKQFEVTQPAAAGTISLDKPSITVGATAASIEINVTTNEAEWQTGTIPDWISITPDKGSGNTNILLSVTENKDEARAYKVRFTADEQTAWLDVDQKGIQLPDPVLILDKTSETVAAAAGSFFVQLTTHGASWSVAEAASWLTVTPSSGDRDSRIAIGYAENPTTEQRSGTVRFVSGELSATLSVIQTSGDEELRLSPSSKQLGANAGNFTLDVTTKGAHWTTYGIPDWVTLSDTYFTGSKTITVSYEANTQNKERSCAIRFTAGSLTKTLTLTQEASEATLSINITSKKVTNIAGSFPMNVTTNSAEWSTAGENAGWLTLSPSSGTGSGSIRVSYTANTDYKERTATIIFRAGKATQRLVVTQEATEIIQPTISLSVTRREVQADKGNFEVEVTSNVSSEIEQIPKWIHPSKTKLSAGKDMVRIDYDANTGGKRFASIKFSAGGASAYLYIEQAAKEEGISATGSWRGKITADADGSTASVTELILTENNSATIHMTADGESVRLTGGTWTQSENQVTVKFVIFYDGVAGGLMLNGALDTAGQSLNGRGKAWGGEDAEVSFTFTRISGANAGITSSHSGTENTVLKKFFTKGPEK